LLWEKITTSWLVAGADLVWKKNTIDWMVEQPAEQIDFAVLDWKHPWIK